MVDCSLKTIFLGGFHTIVATRSQLADRMVRDCVDRDPQAPPKLVFSSNGQGIALAGKDASFAGTMAKADIIHADGMSVVLASRLFAGRSLPERIATTDFFHDAARSASDAGLRFFILGGSEAQNAAAVEAMRRHYPSLLIVGRRNGYFRPDEEAEICREIVECGTDVLWVGLGKPLQETWSVRNRGRLTGVGWVKTCGGLYSFLTGEARRAPDWMQNLSLEWFWRTLQDPRRLLMRYLVTNPVALYRLARHADRGR